MPDVDFQETVKKAVKQYLIFLDAHPGGEEVQYRTPLENLINSIQLPLKNFTAIQEDRRSGIEVDGTPDFFVYEDDRTLFKRLAGFIECKKPSKNIEDIVNSEQIKKYSKTCENIIITNYRRFILLQKGRIVHNIVLSGSPKAVMDFGTLIFDFYQYDYEYIKTKKVLAATLAAQSFYYSIALREFIADPANSADSFYIKFNGLFKEYEKSINYHYELPDFCDVYSQSLVYGLMLARLDTGQNLDEKDLDYLRGIPADYKLLYEFLSQAYESRNLPGPIKIALTNIGKNINLINIEAIEAEFTGAGSDRTSIAVYLYEDFLSQYDKLRKTENRKENGVYYTPHEVTDFIARSVNEIIKSAFGLREGYGAPNVKILDFACGTGTFLHSIFEIMLPEGAEDLARQMAKDKIANDIYGFELLFTPYIIAHTFLTRFLRNKEIHFEGNERLGVYLTNTLDISQHSISALLPRLRLEHEKAMKIKGEEDILAIVGNPPWFSGKSLSVRGYIEDTLMPDYKKGLNEKNIQPVDDIYIKFVRFAEWKIEKNGKGVIGIITNNSWLNGLVHRQMRKHLYETFDEIYIINLHGDSDRREGDKNIFDIKRGNQISFFIKHETPLARKKVWYYSTLKNGILTRNEKLRFFETTAFNRIKWTRVYPEKTKDYWFSKKDFAQKAIYEKFWKITSIFKHYGSGIKTHNDNQLISYKPFNLKDNQAILYRVMDGRFINYDLSKVIRHRYNIMQHLINHDNIAVCFKRELNRDKFSTVFVSTKIIEETMLESSHGGAYLAPLYIYGENADGEHPGKITRIPNFTQHFANSGYLAVLPWKPGKPSPEEVMAYIYAVLHSPVYRAKYAEFLKTDFPAIPMTKDKAAFYKYAGLGQRLIDLHLLNKLPAAPAVKVSTGGVKGEFVIKKITFSNGKLVLGVYAAGANAAVTIEGVTPAVYDFEIGSYKPIEKWLKYRLKDEVPLGVHDLAHLKNMITALHGTITVMTEIEALGEEYLKGVV